MTTANDPNEGEALAPASEILAKPAMSWAEFWQGVLGLPASTAELIAREPDAPHFYLIGRRRYIRKTDALDWIDQKARSAPYFPRRNRKPETKRPRGPYSLA